jgi:uncharacterized protein
MKSDKSSLKKTAKGAAKAVPERGPKPAPPSGKAGKKSASAPAEAATAKSDAPAKPKRKAAPKKAALKIPPILLEGDKPSAPVATGPGRRYALGPVPPAGRPGEAEAELPEAYGTKELFLAARDPHWLYARWDLTREQRRSYNALSADRHLVLRVYIDEAKGEPFSQVHVHPESNHWFVHVGRAGTRFVAELGYYTPAGKWVTISTSGATLTPPDTMSSDTSAQFATIPLDVPLPRLVALIKEAAREHVPVAEAIQQLRAMGYTQLPEQIPATSRAWTPAQERALASLITMDAVRRVWMGSLEITELIRRQLFQEISSAAAAQFGLPTSPAGAVSSISSPFGGESRRKGFWFNVNAELILYGATEPDARVTIGGRVIKLRPDGTFSFRFALPDGVYELPAVAVSADETDGRAAELKFNRSTEYRGEVGTHPQDPRLKAPLAANVA